MDITEENRFEMKIRHRDKNVQKLFCENHDLESYLGLGYMAYQIKLKNSRCVKVSKRTPLF